MEVPGSLAARPRTAAVFANASQLRVLREAFEVSNHCRSHDIPALASETGLAEAWIRSWFGRERNRRPKPVPSSTSDLSSPDISTFKSEYQDSVLPSAWRSSVADDAAKPPSPKRQKRGRKPRAKAPEQTTSVAVKPEPEPQETALLPSDSPQSLNSEQPSFASNFVAAPNNNIPSQPQLVVPGQAPRTANGRPTVPLRRLAPMIRAPLLPRVVAHNYPSPGHPMAHPQRGTLYAGPSAYAPVFPYPDPRFTHPQMPSPHMQNPYPLLTEPSPFYTGSTAQSGLQSPFDIPGMLQTYHANDRSRLQHQSQVHSHTGPALFHPSASASNNTNPAYPAMSEESIYRTIINSSPTASSPARTNTISPLSDLLDMHKAPLKHLTVLHNPDGTYPHDIDEDTLLNRLLDSSLPDRDPFQAAMALVFLSRLGFEWDS